MTEVIYQKIIEAKVKRFKSEKEKKKRFGILINGIFYDLTKELNRIKKEERIIFNKNLNKALMKKAEKIIDKPTNQVTHIIISIGDLEKLNLKE